MGGAIAQELALVRPDLVRSVQIVCSWPHTDPWLAELILQWKSMFFAMGAFDWARTTWVWVFTHRWFRRSGEDGRASSTTPNHIRIRRRRRCSHASATPLVPFDARDRLGAIAAPTHVIAGEEDIFTPPRFSGRSRRRFPGATLTILPEVGHGMFWETPDAFNAALLGFLDRQLRMSDQRSLETTPVSGAFLELSLPHRPVPVYRAGVLRRRRRERLC